MTKATRGFAQIHGRDVRTDELNALRALTDGYQALEPPRYNMLASLVARWSIARGSGRVTPHYEPEAAHSEKTEYEYAGAMEFFERFGGTVCLHDLDGKDVLDAGCGWGGKAIHYAKHSDLSTITGFDLPGFDPAVPTEWANERGVENCHFKVGYAESMPVPDLSADVIIMDDVLEHVQDPARVVAEWERVLRPGGVVVARFPSIKMMFAHHFDRVTTLPALHRVMSMRRWSQGFNHYVATTNTPILPFSRIETRFGREVNIDLSGMAAEDFERLILQSRLYIERLELEPGRARSASALGHVLWRVYSAAHSRREFREFLSVTISFVGRKPV